MQQEILIYLALILIQETSLILMVILILVNYLLKFTITIIMQQVVEEAVVLQIVLALLGLANQELVQLQLIWLLAVDQAVQ